MIVKDIKKLHTNLCVVNIAYHWKDSTRVITPRSELTLSRLNHKLEE